MSKGAAPAENLESLDRSKAGLSLLPSSLLACTHIALASTGPEHSYLLYIRHHVIMWSQHNGNQKRQHNFTGFFCGLFCVIVVIDGMSNHCMPEHTFSNRGRVNKVYHAWEWYGLLTPAKQTGPWGSNVLGHDIDCLVWVFLDFSNQSTATLAVVLWAKCNTSRLAVMMPTCWYVSRNNVFHCLILL